MKLYIRYQTCGAWGYWFTLQAGYRKLLAPDHWRTLEQGEPLNFGEAQIQRVPDADVTTHNENVRRFREAKHTAKPSDYHVET